MNVGIRVQRLHEFEWNGKDPNILASFKLRPAKYSVELIENFFSLDENENKLAAVQGIALLFVNLLICFLSFICLKKQNGAGK